MNDLVKLNINIFFCIFQRKFKSLRCQFKEEYSKDKYTHYKTADATKDWYLGFNKNGKPLKGTDINNKFNVKNQDCFKFQKLHQTRTSGQAICPGNGDGPERVNFCDNHILNMLKQNSSVRAKNRKRHDSNHNKRRGKG